MKVNELITHLGFPQQGPREAYQLTLPHREVFPALADLVVKPIRQSCHVLLEVGQLQSSPNLLICPLRRGIQVEPDIPREEDWILGDDGETRPQLVETQFGNVVPVDRDLATRSFHDAKEGQGEAALPRAGPPADAHLLPGADVHVDSLEDEVEAGPVSSREVLERDGPVLRPLLRQQHLALGNFNIGLLRVVRVLENPLDGNRVRLEVAEHPDQPVEGVRHVEGVGDGQSRESRADEAPTQDGEDGGEEDHEVADGLDAHAQPPVAAHAEVEAAHAVHDVLFRLQAEAVLLLEGADRGHSVDALGEVREDGALLDRFNPLQLARGGDVVPLHEEIDAEYRREDGEEEWRRVRYHGYHAQDLEEAVREVRQFEGDRIVNCVNIGGESATRRAGHTKPTQDLLFTT